MTSLDLAGLWHLSDDSAEHQAEISLPGDIITGLQTAGLIGDPYFGQNEYDLRWIAERDWTVNRKVTLNRTDLSLLLSGLDTVAEVRVNGQMVLEAHNAFRSYRIDISEVLVTGENTFEIRFPSAPKAAQAEQDAQPFYVPYHQGNCPIPNGNMLRKPQCDFGWDWNIALAPFGLYGEMRLELLSAVTVTEVLVNQHHSGDAVTLDIRASLAKPAPGTLPYEISICDQILSGEVPVGDTALSGQITIRDPDLWWPAGLGSQALHTLTLRIGDKITTRRVGLRDIALVTEPDAAGTGFKFRVKGRDIFARGANWIPADALAGRITQEAVRDLLQSAVDANMNMIRVWGGGRYETDWFYDLCDEMGLLVWQDFMFACNLYPATDAFLEEVRAEVRENVARLQHHACLALWCGDNELIGALTWFPESVKDRDRYLVAYDRLNRTVEAALKETDPHANWWPSSPSPGPMSFGDAWHDDSSGDMHFWSVWHEGRDFDHYRDVSPRFCSEFGFQSYPSMDVIRSFADPEDFNIAARVMESHQKNAGGNARIAETMFRYFRFPVDFENFVYLSQVQQGLAIKTAVTHWRSLKPHCMGTLFWQLNDTWPVCSWSSLDYRGGWKLLHHMAKDFYAPLLVTVIPKEDRLAVMAVNDGPNRQTGTIEVFVLAMDGTQRLLSTVDADIDTDAAQECSNIAYDAFRADEMLYHRWTGPDGVRCDHFAPRPYKSYDLRASGLSAEITHRHDHSAIMLRCAAPAFFASVEADQPGRFSDNAVLVLPDEPVTLTFEPATAGAEPRFIVRDLQSATYGLPTSSPFSDHTNKERVP